MALPDVALISLETARAWFSDLPSVDADLERLIGAASSAAERISRRRLAARDLVVTLDSYGHRTLVLPVYPIQSITHVRIDSSGEFGADTAVTDYVSDAERGMLLRRAGWPRGWQNIQVSYRGGIEVDQVHEEIQRAVAVTAKWMHRREQEQAVGVRSITSPDGINTAIDMLIPVEARSVFEAIQEVRI